jgi:hypothetical protein
MSELGKSFMWVSNVDTVRLYARSDRTEPFAAASSPIPNLADSSLASRAVKEGCPLLAILTECRSVSLEDAIDAIVSASGPAVSSRFDALPELT